MPSGLSRATFFGLTKMALLIIGVDPGTTLGYAILNDKGEFLTSGSGKEFSIGELISSIISYGKPFIVACDKNPAPGFVVSLAVKLGAKLSYPPEDLLVEDKRALVKGFDAKLNSHEMDALASAVYALQKHERFLEKIEHFIEKKCKQALEEDVKLIMARNEELPLEAALRMAEEKYLPKEKAVPEKRIVQAPAKNASERKLEELRLQILVLEERNKKLRKLLKEKEKLVARLKKRLGSTPGEELVGYKEKRIKHYTKQLKDNDRLIQHYEKELRRRDEFIVALKNRLLVKKLKDLGRDEFNAKRFLEISEEDILLVDNPNIFSQRVIDEIRGKVRIILTDNPPKKIEQGFVFIKPEGILIIEAKNFAIADKKALEQALQKKDILKSILEEYKKERTKED